MRDLDVIQNKINFLRTFVDKLPINETFTEWRLFRITPYVIAIGITCYDTNKDMYLYFSATIFDNKTIQVRDVNICNNEHPDKQKCNKIRMEIQEILSDLI